MSKEFYGITYFGLSNVVRSIINFVLMILIARLLGTEDYGLWITATTFVHLFAIIGLQGLDKVIVREGSKDVANLRIILENTIEFRKLLSFFSIALCMLVVFFMPYSSTVVFIIIFLSSWLLLDNLATFVNTIFQASENFRTLSFLNLFHTSMNFVVIVSSLLLGYGLQGLLFSSVLVSVLNLLVRIYFSKKITNFTFFPGIKSNGELIGQGFVYTLIEFLNAIAIKIDILMLTLLTTPINVAIYSVAYKIASQLDIFKNSVSVVFFPSIVKNFQREPLRRRDFFTVSFGVLVTFSIAALLVFHYIDSFISYLFGEEYKTAGKILQILILYQGINWSYVPFTLLLQATNNQNLDLFISSFKALLNIPLNLIFFAKFGLIGIAYSTVTVVSLGNLLGIILILFKTKNSRNLI